MEIPIFMGQWMNSISRQMSSASDGDVFLLPSFMHLHAFELIKQEHFPDKDIKVKVRQ
jgi:hypothetical protein